MNFSHHQGLLRAAERCHGGFGQNAFYIFTSALSAAQQEKHTSLRNEYESQCLAKTLSTKIMHSSLSCFLQEKGKAHHATKEADQWCTKFLKQAVKTLFDKRHLLSDKGKGKGKRKHPLPPFFQSSYRWPDQTATKCNRSASLFLKPGLIALLIS